MHLRCINSHRNLTSTRLFAVGKPNFLTKFRMYRGISDGISKVVNFMLPHFMPAQKVLVLKNNVQQYRNWLGLSYQSIPIQGKYRDGLIKRARGQSPTITAPSNRMNLWRMRLIFTCFVMSFEMVLKFVNLTEKWCHC